MKKQTKTETRENKGLQAATYVATVFLAAVLTLLAIILYKGAVAAPLASTPDSETMLSDSAANALCPVGAVTVVAVNSVVPEFNGMVHNTLHYNVLLRADSCGNAQRIFRIRKTDAVSGIYDRIESRDSALANFKLRTK